MFFSFADDIKYMTGKKPWRLWLICWKYISPVIILILLIADIYRLASSGMTYKAYVCGDPVSSSSFFLFCAFFNISA